MLKNFFKTALRTLTRNWSYSVINILGLSLGISCCLFIYFSLRYDLSFDKHHPKAKNIYRFVTEFTGANPGFGEGSPYPYLKFLRADFDEFTAETMISAWRSPLVKVGDSTQKAAKLFQENKDRDEMAFVEPQYFTLFNYTWLKGNPKKALSDPGSIVLTRKLAEKYFGNEDPMGRILRINNKMDVQVTGVVEDPPVTTDFPFTVFVSFSSLRKFMGDWILDEKDATYSGAQIYILLPDNVSPKAIEKKLVAFNKKYKVARDAEQSILHLQPLEDIHFNSKMGNYADRVVPKQTLWAMALIGVFLLITACINFINLATAQSIKRSKEVGVRKVLGGNRRELMKQFLLETFILTFAAVLISLFITEVSKAYISGLLNVKLDLNVFNNVTALLFLLFLLIVTSLLAGFYPALVMSGYKPALALKGKITSPGKGSLTLRSSLVVVQFVITQVLLISTVVVFSQMKYFRTAKLGYVKEAVVTVPLPEYKPGKLESLRAKLERNPAIKDFSYSMSPPSSNGNWNTSIKIDTASEDADFGVVMRPADTSYFSTYNLELLAGRIYVPTDTMNEIVINETFMKKMGFTDPQKILGRKVKLGEEHEKPIVGVVKDFNTFSLHSATAPCALVSKSNSYEVLNIKLFIKDGDISDLNKTMKFVEESWSQTYPDFLFSYKFLDEIVENFYRNEKRVYSLFTLFSGIAIFIGCLGLYGIISFISEARRKEVGIRKVLGASVSQIVVLFSKQFAYLVILAFIISAPIGWYMMTGWLKDFENKIPLHWGIFAFAGFTALFIALATISFRSIQAALANPVKSLRSE